MLYRELSKNFLTVHGIWQPFSDASLPIKDTWVGEYFSLAVDFSGRDVLRKAPEIYLAMKEHMTVEVLYVALARLPKLDVEDADYHVKNFLFLLSWTLLNNQHMRDSLIAAIGANKAENVLVKAKACLDNIGLMPALLAHVQSRAQHST